MNKLITSLAFLVISVSSVLAQSNGMGTNDPEAKKILDAVSAKFKTFKEVQAKFSLKIENAVGKNLGTKTGTVYMKATKYRVTITGQEIFCDGTNISTYDKSANEVTITKIDPTANSLTPQKVFTNFYDKDFLYKLNGETTVAGKKIQEIELTPIDKSKPFFKVLVAIDKATQTIRQTKVFEKNGNRYTYSVVSMSTNTNLPDNLFVFDTSKYPKVEVIDLR